MKDCTTCTNRILMSISMCKDCDGGNHYEHIAEGLLRVSKIAQDRCQDYDKLYMHIQELNNKLTDSVADAAKHKYRLGNASYELGVATRKLFEIKEAFVPFSFEDNGSTRKGILVHSKFIESEYLYNLLKN